MGQDKALLEWQGKPLWQAQVAKLWALGAVRLIIACREEQNLHHNETLDPQVEWLFDPPGEDLGPISAIARGLEGSLHPLLVLAVDMPWMTAEFMGDHLLDLRLEDRGLFYQGPHGYEPLAGIYTPRMLGRLVDALQKGRLSLQPLVEKAVTSGDADVRPMTDETRGFFQNTNTREEWNRLGLTN